MLLKAGDFYAKLMDQLYAPQMNEEPKLDEKKASFAEQHHAHDDSTSAAYGAVKGPLSCELISQKLHLQLSCETITSILDIVRRVSTTVKEKLAVANSVFENLNSDVDTSVVSF